MSIISFYFVLRKEAKKFLDINLKIKTISYKRQLINVTNFMQVPVMIMTKLYQKSLKNKYVAAVFDHWINFEKRILQNIYQMKLGFLMKYQKY